MVNENLFISRMMKNIRTQVLTKPDCLYISPRNADNNELFPEPTGPTTATNEPFLILTLISRNTENPSLLSQEKVPFSTTTDSAEMLEVLFLNYMHDISF